MECNHLPIIEVNTENFEVMWPALKNAIKEATFVALDCELSGLGTRHKLNCSEIDSRYKFIKEIAEEYSIVSLGISCFQFESCGDVEFKENGRKFHSISRNYLVQTFNILTLCSTKYSIDVRCVKFLLLHGFNFNHQYAHGLPYTRSSESEECIKNNNTQPKLDVSTSSPSVKTLFDLIIYHEKPIVLHNGFVDLIFLYEAFYCPLPGRVDTFSADLTQMFTGGVFDTKYMGEFITQQQFQATYLEAMFKLVQLQNVSRSKKGCYHTKLSFPPYPLAGVEGLTWYNHLSVFEPLQDESTAVCESYKFHGWCTKSEKCEKSHNADRLVRSMRAAPPRKRRGGHGPVPLSSGGFGARESVAQIIQAKKFKVAQEEGSRILSNSENGRTRRERRFRQRKRKRSRPNSQASSYDRESDERSEFEEVDGSIGDASCDSSAISFETAEIKLNNSTDILKQNFTSGPPDILKQNFTSGRTSLDSHQLTAKLGSLNGNGLSVTDQDASLNSNIDAISEKERDSESVGAVCNGISKTYNERSLVTNKSKSNKGGHRAGYDAFMTGYVFACLLNTSQFRKYKDDTSIETNLDKQASFFEDKSDATLATEFDVSAASGRVYLVGKPFPFLVRTSPYGNNSVKHAKRIIDIRTNDYKLP